MILEMAKASKRIVKCPQKEILNLVIVHLE